MHPSEDDVFRRRAQRSWLAIILSWWKSKHGLARKRSLAGAALAAAAMAAAYKHHRGARGGGGDTPTSRLHAYVAGLISSQLQRRREGLSHRSASEAPLSVLWKEAKLGNVQRALVSSGTIAYKLQDQSEWKRSHLPSSSNLSSTLIETLTQNGCDNVASMPESIWKQLATPALTIAPFLYLYAVYRILRHVSGSDDKAATHDNIDIRTTFSDVAGIDSAVREVSELVSYLRRPSIYQSVGARAPRGVLLHGPPGSGKTLLARAVAGECGHRCAFVACCGSDFVDTYVGRGASRIRKLFREARDRARRKHEKWGAAGESDATQPCAIIFIDEIDALAKARSSSTYMSNDERDQTLNQLLTCMDGFSENEDNVTMILIGATNRPDILDPALLRRMDRKVAVALPNQVGRRAILQIHAKHVQCSGEIDWNHLALQTDGFSGAELKTVVNEAALLAVRQRGASVQQHHLTQAAMKVQDMKGAMRGPQHGGFVLR